jgi:hypothetical protein
MHTHKFWELIVEKCGDDGKERVRRLPGGDRGAWGGPHLADFLEEHPQSVRAAEHAGGLAYLRPSPNVFKYIVVASLICGKGRADMAHHPNYHHHSCHYSMVLSHFTEDLILHPPENGVRGGSGNNT